MRGRNLRLYLVIILPLLACILYLLQIGKGLVPSDYVSVVKNPHSGSANIADSFQHPLTVLLMQIIVVLAAAKFTGYVFKLIGQQSVIGETFAGIFLGPSLFGLVAPDAFHTLFPAASLGNLQLLSQVGLLLFMFIIGMELDVELLRNRASEAVVISHVSIVFPYLLGVILAYFIYSTFAPANTPFVAYALFMGIAMSITAFPVLARILKERKITKTPIGSMALICAAINDVSAWCILPVVIAISRAGDISGALLTILFSIVYVLVMMFGVKPALKALSNRYYSNGNLQAPYIAIIFLTLFISAFVSEIIGIHALFGAFLAGVIMPTNVSLRKLFAERVEDVSTMLLLPLFFAFTGLRTQLGLLNTGYLWMIGCIITALAMLGKLGGTAAAARLTGQNWKDSLSIGVLMNTRGLMEIIVLNIGYDLGILKPEIFTMMVFMALTTTFLTGPLLNLIERLWGKTV